MRLLSLIVAVILTTVCGGGARAAEVQVPEAKRHVELGNGHYEAGRYDEAIKEFELAYRLSHRPAILFNIARAEAKLGHEENAIAFLRRYLEERPNADDAPAVLAEIEAREKALAAARDKATADKLKAKAEAEAAEARRHAAEAQHATEEAQRVAEEAVRRQAEAQHHDEAARARAERLTTMKRVGYALIVIGPLLAATGIGLGVAASRAADEISAAGGPFDAHLAGVESRGRAFNSAGIALDTFGVAAAVAGAVLIGYAHTRPSPKDHAWLIVPTGSGVAIGGAF